MRSLFAVVVALLLGSVAIAQPEQPVHPRGDIGYVAGRIMTVQVKNPDGITALVKGSGPYTPTWSVTWEFNEKCDIYSGSTFHSVARTQMRVLVELDRNSVDTGHEGYSPCPAHVVFWLGRLEFEDAVKDYHRFQQKNAEVVREKAFIRGLLENRK